MMTSVGPGLSTVTIDLSSWEACPVAVNMTGCNVRIDFLLRLADKKRYRPKIGKVVDMQNCYQSSDCLRNDVGIIASTGE